MNKSFTSTVLSKLSINKDFFIFLFLSLTFWANVQSFAQCGTTTVSNWSSGGWTATGGGYAIEDNNSGGSTLSGSFTNIGLNSSNQLVLTIPIGARNTSDVTSGYGNTGSMQLTINGTTYVNFNNPSGSSSFSASGAAGASVSPGSASIATGCFGGSCGPTTFTVTIPLPAGTTTANIGFVFGGSTDDWYVGTNTISVPKLCSFSFNCTSVSPTYTGTFVANGVGGQTGTITVPITSAKAGAVNFTVSGNGFTGSLATTLTAGQTSVTIPVTYNGTGNPGTKNVTISNTNGTSPNSCSVPIEVGGTCTIPNGSTITKNTNCDPPYNGAVTITAPIASKFTV